jgi:hypothetical protein
LQVCNSNVVTGDPPSPRSGHGFAEAAGKLFVFGGNTAGLYSSSGETKVLFKYLKKLNRESLKRFFLFDSIEHV